MAEILVHFCPNHSHQSHKETLKMFVSYWLCSFTVNKISNISAVLCRKYNIQIKKLNNTSRWVIKWHAVESPHSNNVNAFHFKPKQHNKTAFFILSVQNEWKRCNANKELFSMTIANICDVFLFCPQRISDAIYCIFSIYTVYHYISTFSFRL